MNDGQSKDKISEGQQRAFELLSQETCHLLVQIVLGHPEHLMSFAELDHAIPDDSTDVRNELDKLVEAGILDRYCIESGATERDLPSEFYGPTEQDIEILNNYRYLRGVPVVRSLYRNTEKPSEIERHENAPRPDLPAGVVGILSTDGREETERPAED